MMQLLKTLPYKRSKKGIIISVRVEPKAGWKGISGIVGETIKVKVTSPPEGGKANKELIDVLSSAFGIKKSSVKVIKGITARNKAVEIEGIEFW